MNWPKLIFKSGYWCTRTRVPAAYAAAKRYNDILPDLTQIEKNKEHAEFHEKIAKLVYGQEISFQRETFLMTGSYKNVEKYTRLRRRKNHAGKISQIFDRLICYEKNETIFIISKLKHSLLFKYAFIMLAQLFSEKMNLLREIVYPEKWVCIY